MNLFYNDNELKQYNGFIIEINEGYGHNYQFDNAIPYKDGDYFLLSKYEYQTETYALIKINSNRDKGYEFVITQEVNKKNKTEDKIHKYLKENNLIP